MGTISTVKPHMTRSLGQLLITNSLLLISEAGFLMPYWHKTYI